MEFKKQYNKKAFLLKFIPPEVLFHASHVGMPQQINSKFSRTFQDLLQRFLYECLKCPARDSFGNSQEDNPKNNSEIAIDIPSGITPEFIRKLLQILPGTDSGIAG